MRPTTPITRLLAALVALTVLFAACGDDGDDDAAATDDTEASTTDDSAADGGEVVEGPVTIDIVDFEYDPVAVTVEAGAEITFVNADSQPHTATSSETGVFDTDSLDTDESTTVTVSEPGTYEYFCSFHPFMKATLTVQ